MLVWYEGFQNTGLSYEKLFIYFIRLFLENFYLFLELAMQTAVIILSRFKINSIFIGLICVQLID